MTYQKVFSVIPAYNAGKTLRTVVDALRQYLPEVSIIVINDGSSDNTSEIAKELGVVSFEHQENLGKGAALKTGIAKALLDGADLVFTLDADAQHDPSECKKFINKMQSENLDLVIGSRMLKLESMPFYRQVSNRLTSMLISFRISQKIADSQSGFRLYRAKVLESMGLSSNRFEIDSEILIKAALSGFRIGSINIEAIYPSNQSSSIRVVDLFRFLQIYLQSFFWRV